MAAIVERKYPSGRVVWRVVLKRKKVRTFCLTFDDRDEACDWAEKNEGKFIKNPEKYFAWREQFYYAMRRGAERIKDHIVLSKLRLS